MGGAVRQRKGVLRRNALGDDEAIPAGAHLRRGRSSSHGEESQHSKSEAHAWTALGRGIGGGSRNEETGVVV